MQFLVIGENIDPGYLVPPDQQLQAIEQAVVPSFQIFAQWEREGRLKGGLFPGERAGAFVIEADSVEELDRLMNQVPFFGLVKWNVKPLVPWQTMARQLPQYVQQFRENLQRQTRR